ncbi:outer membrane lipoprotein-sorting protein [Candidatus Marinamargulisbacteria bacterium SCGC AAA071-K20]|nr:outer membrane lipoprotein-sorting protein [Candidatus Marinamargulisbacteria bacterium SCGC AAA071-K20]
MKLIKTIGMMVLLLSLSTFGITAEQKGLNIAIANDKANTGFKTETNDSTMVLINAYGDKIERKMRFKSSETKNDGDKSIIEFLWPADVKGTRMLTYTHKNRNDDQWLFLPALNRIKRISSNNQSGSFMGSEFAYEDISSEEIEKYTYKLIKNDTLNGRAVWVIERIPTNKKSGYSKQISFTDKVYKNPLKIEYYDRKGERLKTSTFSGFKQYGKYWRQSKIEIINHQTQKSSVLTWSNRKMGIPIPANDFHKNSLMN